MKTYITLTLLLSMLTTTLPSFAEPPTPWRPEPIPPGEDVIVPLRKEGAAPFDGVLFDPDTARRWAGYIQQAKDVVARERDAHDRVLAIELKRARDTQALLLEAKNRDLLLSLQRIQELEKKAAQPQPFYQTPWFGASVAAVLLAGGYLLFK